MIISQMRYCPIFILINYNNGGQAIWVRRNCSIRLWFRRECRSQTRGAWCCRPKFCREKWIVKKLVVKS